MFGLNLEPGLAHFDHALPQAIENLERRRIRVGNDLGDAVMVAQVHEQQLAVVALAMDPAG